MVEKFAQQQSGPSAVTKIPSQVNEIFHALRLILEPGQVAELRCPGTQKGTISGYFNDIKKMSHAAAALSGKVEAVYVTLNPIDPALLARAANRTKDRAKHTTSDVNILCRRWLLIDLDAQRPAGISSTDEQHTVALARSVKVRSWLSERGWPVPIAADSGNGGHLLYHVDLPNSEESTRLVDRSLKALAFHFDDEAVKVDQTTGNAARISKVYGTLAGKGDSIPGYPHRLARILEVPGRLEVVSREQLEELAAILPEEPKAAGQAHTNGNGGGSFDLEAWITKHGLNVIGPRSWGDGRKWIFPVCLWNPDHTNESAYALQFGNGAVAASRMPSQRLQR